MMQPAIGYLRVSTQEQSRRGLGLAAQRHEIEGFGRAKDSRSTLGTRTCRPGAERTRYCCDPGLRRLCIAHCDHISGARIVP